MSSEEVLAKAEGLIEPVMGEARTKALLAALMAIESLPDIRVLRPLLQRPWAR